MKNTWKQLKPEHQLKIRTAAKKYSSAKRLKYTLMASDGWYDNSYDVNGADIMYGIKFLKQNNE